MRTPLSLTRLRAVARKETLHLLRDRRSLGLAFVLPALMVLAFGWVITFDIRYMPMAVYDEDRTAASRALVDAFADPAGFDCSGFVQYVYARAGTALPRSVREQWNAGRPVESGDVRRGDLVFFAIGGREVSHDGLARKFLTARERAAIASLDEDARRRAFLRRWTCKEAMSKATGDGLSAPFRRIAVALSPGLALREGPGPYRPEEWTLVAAPAPDGFIATVALWERNDFTHRPVSDTSSASATTGSPRGAQGSPAPRAARTSP